MELPFKYIVLQMIKMLNDRKMKLTIDRDIIEEFILEYIKKSFYTISEKREICSNFNFEYELDNLLSEYYQYFDVDGIKISFDNDYIDELDELINDQIEEIGISNIEDINYVINNEIIFLEILGVNLNYDLYEFFMDIERELELCYEELCELDTFVNLDKIDTKELINEMKKMHLQKIIALINTKNKLTSIQYQDLMLCAENYVNIDDELGDLSLLVEDNDFFESDIIEDTFLSSIFTGNDLYNLNLRDYLIINSGIITNEEKNNKIRFYMTFLELLEDEIKNSREILNVELIRVKYRVINILDSTYGTTLFLKNNPQINYNNCNEDYNFISNAVYYFINELLHYDDNKYKNTENDTDNIIVYLNSIIKKILIKTYYKLTGDKDIINAIKENELYGINAISSSYLKEIIEKPKIKTKKV